jgi:hypothetical protein
MLAAKQKKTMELTIGEWYNESGINFEFSHRISNYIRIVVKECIMAPLGLIDNYTDKFLHLTVTTTSKQKDLEVKMGTIKIKATSVNCGLWFPYKEIINSPNPINTYVENYIKSFPLVFKRWGVTDQQINEAATKIRREIIGNPYYELTKDEKREIEETKQTTIRIKKELGLE